MKRILTFVCMLSLLVLMFTGCVAIETLGWQTVEFENCGTLKIPADWTCRETDGLVYILDSSHKPVMIETKCWATPDGRHGETESNEFFKNITNLRPLSSAVFSNGAIHGTYLTDHDGTQSEKFFLEIGYDRTLEFLVWDETMDERMLKTIAQTFVAAD